MVDSGDDGDGSDLDVFQFGGVGEHDVDATCRCPSGGDGDEAESFVGIAEDVEGVYNLMGVHVGKVVLLRRAVLWESENPSLLVCFPSFGGGRGGTRSGRFL